MDNFTKEMRSHIMRAVKSRGNISTEVALINFFKKKKIKGWRRNCKLYGKPDFAFPREKVAVFADGCFWHGHNCRNVKPKSHFKYWQNKIERNKKRDKEVSKALRKKGWRVFRIFECKIRESKIPTALQKALKDENHQVRPKG